MKHVRHFKTRLPTSQLAAITNVHICSLFDMVVYLDRSPFDTAETNVI
jgi:hypothetical protein